MSLGAPYIEAIRYFCLFTYIFAQKCLFLKEISIIYLI